MHTSTMGLCSGPAICHRALVMAECQRGVRNPFVVALFVLAAFWEHLIVNNDVHYIIL